MKGTFRRVYTTLILAVGFLAFTACSNEVDEGSKEGPAAVLPTFEDILVRSGYTGSIDFTAPAVWQMSTDKPNWFKLSAETGTAGKQTVSYTVTDNGIGFADDVAIITLSSGKSTPSTFKATRTSKDRSLTFYTRDAENEWIEIPALDLVFSDNAQDYNIGYKVVANFDWKLTTPDWISIEPDHTSGDSNTNVELDQVAIGWMQVNYAKAKAENMSGELIFADRKATSQNVKATVTCPGSTNYMKSTAALAVALNPDGKYVTKEIVDNKEVEVLLDAYNFNVTAGNDDVTIFKVWKDLSNGFYGVDPSGSGNLQYVARWCGVDLLDTKVIGPHVKEFSYEIWSQAVGDVSRAATIIAIPSAMAAGLTELNMVASDEKSIDEKYQRYVITELTQESAFGFSFAYPQNVSGITLSKMAEGEELTEIMGTYGVQSAYTMTYESFEAATLAGLKFAGVDPGTISVSYAPAEAQLNENAKTGWVDFAIGELYTIFISDEFVPFTTQRNALIILQTNGTPLSALKVVQTAPKASAVE